MQETYHIPHVKYKQAHELGHVECSTVRQDKIHLGMWVQQTQAHLSCVHFHCAVELVAVAVHGDAVMANEYVPMPLYEHSHWYYYYLSS